MESQKSDILEIMEENESGTNESNLTENENLDENKKMTNDVKSPYENKDISHENTENAHENIDNSHANTENEHKNDDIENVHQVELNANEKIESESKENDKNLEKAPEKNDKNLENAPEKKDTNLENAPEIIKMVNDGNFSGVKEALLTNTGKTSDIDGCGMTPLHHAAYRGNLELCKLLIEYGSDVHSDSQEHRYTPLHFAALSNNEKVVKLLLDHGAKSHVTNSLKKTPAQLAGFVGNRLIVAVIDNYVPVSDFEYYTIRQELELEPRLPLSCVVPLHALVTAANLHPVSIAMKVERRKEILNNLKKCFKILDIMVEKEVKNVENSNQVLSIKLHFISYVLKTIEKEKTKNEQDKENEKNSVFEKLIKKWLYINPSNCKEECLESFVIEAVKSFPYPDMPLFVHVVKGLMSNGDSISALESLSGVIYGQNRSEHTVCSTCGEENRKAKKCSRCKSVMYCDANCQKLHWSNHKKVCDKIFQS